MQEYPGVVLSEESTTTLIDGSLAGTAETPVAWRSRGAGASGGAPRAAGRARPPQRRMRACSGDAAKAPHIFRSARSLLNECHAGRSADLESGRSLFQPDRTRSRRRPQARRRPTREAFARDYEGKVAGLDGKALGGAVARFEKLQDLMGRIGSYASLYYAQDMADPERGRFSQNVSEALTDIGTRLVFFRLELNKLEDADLAARQKDPALAKYGRGCATSACSARTSSPTSWRRRCTRNTSSATPPGRACSTRPSRACAILSATRC